MEINTQTFAAIPQWDEGHIGDGELRNDNKNFLLLIHALRELPQTNPHSHEYHRFVKILGQGEAILQNYIDSFSKFYAMYDENIPKREIAVLKDIKEAFSSIGRKASGMGKEL